MSRMEPLDGSEIAGSWGWEGVRQPGTERPRILQAFAGASPTPLLSSGRPRQCLIRLHNGPLRRSEQPFDTGQEFGNVEGLGQVGIRCDPARVPYPVV